jgi:hypothetical protein
MDINEWLASKYELVLDALGRACVRSALTSVAEVGQLQPTLSAR